MKDGERPNLLERLHSICVRNRRILLSVADLTCDASSLSFDFASPGTHIASVCRWAHTPIFKSCQEDHGTRACPTCELVVEDCVKRY